MIHLSNSTLCTIKRNMWFEAIWKVKRDNKYLFRLLVAWRLLSSLLSTSVAIVSCWSLGLLGDGCGYQPQRMCLVCSPKLPPKEWTTWAVLVDSRLSHISALIRFWLSIFDIYMYNYMWETKKLILCYTGWITSNMKCSKVNNILTSNSSGSGFRIPGLDYHSTGSHNNEPIPIAQQVHCFNTGQLLLIAQGCFTSDNNKVREVKG